MPTLRVAILWHFHQPSYRDPRTDRYRYPWVFLHAARHYHSMAVIARSRPETRMAFNFTPVLIEQLDHYAAGGELEDRILEAILRPAEDLDDEELDLVLGHVFKLHARTMIQPFPRYRELRGLLGDWSPHTRRPRVTVRDIRDLQVLYLLTWCGTALRATEEIRALMEKEREYTEADKEVAFAAMRRAVAETLPLCRELQDAGQVELTTTPYYHPILPLIIDAASARESRSDVALDDIEFRYPEDAAWHLREARRSHREHFARDPDGVWPSEGSVSDAALGMMADHGFRWAGTDEGILARSLGRAGPRDKYRPYRFADTDLWLYFRDRELSDRIGFVYSGWEAAEAVDDVIGRLRAIRRGLGRGAGDACVSIILDGENPWEYYPDSGLGFLSGLYERIAAAEDLDTVRFCDHRGSVEGVSSLRHVVPGSWIESNFDTWIGGPEKNRAWTVLAASRRKLAVEASAAAVPVEFYRAEGSDWFWWLGPGHDTPYESSYEEIFRLNLRNGLEKVDIRPPAVLDRAVVTVPSRLLELPLHRTTPRITGLPGNYYDWVGAGRLEASEGSFHRIHRYLDRIRFGFDLENLYLRVEGNLEILDEPERDACVRVSFERPAGLRFEYSRGAFRAFDREEKETAFRGRVARDVFLDAAIPFAEIGVEVGEPVAFSVSMTSEGREIDRIPQSGSVAVLRPGPDFGLENWSA